ncbi:uncharacterized protein LOC143286457 [Babylonia areolata]|uniref:uncharacterized protein LOC143286457 n=1 Tax=Babylonia areolata TaxID=304850 RepID=UPI003FD56286
MSSRRDRYPVFVAINRKVKVSDIEQLLKDGKSPNSSPPGCPPPLHRAVRFNRPDIALALLQSGCQVRASKRVEQHHSPIISIAASLSMTEVVLTLCRHPDCNVFAVDGQLRTIVHIAVVRRNCDLLKGLLSCCSNFSKFLTLRDGLGLTPLHLAASVGSVRILKLLLQMEEDECFESEQLQKPQSDLPDKDFRVPEFQKPHEHCQEPQSDLADKDFRVPEFQKPHEHCQKPQSDLADKDFCVPEFQKPCEQFQKPHEQCQKPISDLSNEEFSVPESHRNCHCHGAVETNVEEGSVSGKKSSSVEPAGRQSSAAVCQKQGMRLLDHPVLGSKETMLHLAARGYHVEVVQFLLDSGASVNVRDMMNSTPLHQLVAQGNASHRALDAARLLLKAGADWSLKAAFQVHRSEKSGVKGAVVSHRFHHLHKEVTVGMTAAFRNKVAYLKLLAEFGARFEEVDGENRTTLMHALSNGSEEAAMFLLTSHPERDVFHTWLDNWGFTALHMVSYCRSKAGQLTRLMLGMGYGIALWSSRTDDRSCSDDNPVPFWSVRGRIVPFKRGSPGHHCFTPVTQAIMNSRLDVLQSLVRHSPVCLLLDYTTFRHSPLHVALTQIPDQQCMLFIDFLLAHGCDGNAVVCGSTAYHYAVNHARRNGKDAQLFSAAYLKKKLGVFFVEAECSDKRNARGLWSLRDMGLQRVRQMLRAAKGKYFDDASSLPLPPSVIRDLLFES